MRQCRICRRARSRQQERQRPAACHNTSTKAGEVCSRPVGKQARSLQPCTQHPSQRTLAQTCTSRPRSQPAPPADLRSSNPACQWPRAPRNARRRDAEPGQPAGPPRRGAVPLAGQPRGAAGRRRDADRGALGGTSSMLAALAASDAAALPRASCKEPKVCAILAKPTRPVLPPVQASMAEIRAAAAQLSAGVDQVKTGRAMRG